MCVNFTPINRTTLSALVKTEHVPEHPVSTFPDYAAPVRRTDGENGMRADLGVFGLLPAWAKDRVFGKRTYKTRTQTVAEKPSYRSAWAKVQFCLDPMHQFFELCWETGKAVRCRIHRNEHDRFAVAAVWDQWVDKSSGEIVFSFSMLTINADGHPVMGRFHRPTDERRSLVVMPPASWGDWLIAKPDEAAALMLPMDEKYFAAAPAEALHAKAQALF